MCPPRCTDEDMVTAVGWSSTNELLSVGDDHAVHRWAMDGESQGKVRETQIDLSDSGGLLTHHRSQVCDTESYVTALHWFPSVGNRQQPGSDVFVIACTDGALSPLADPGSS